MTILLVGTSSLMVTGSFGDSTATTGFAGSNLATFGCITVVAVDVCFGVSADAFAMSFFMFVDVFSVSVDDVCLCMRVDVSPCVSMS